MGRKGSKVQILSPPWPALQAGRYADQLYAGMAKALIFGLVVPLVKLVDSSLHPKLYLAQPFILIFCR